MPIGVLSVVMAVALGGLLGSAVGDRLSDAFKANMTLVLGACAMSMGIASIVLMKNMPAVIFSVLVGSMAGTLMDLDGLIRRGTGRALAKLNLGGDIDMRLMMTATVLFCFSGTGIYGALISGMDGDHSILIAKSMLDFFTAMIFACQLRRAVALISIPQCALLLLLFFSARLVLPLTQESMIADFKACGGIVLLATGFTIMKVKDIPVANMVPAMAVVMPVSWLWERFIVPMM